MTIRPNLLVSACLLLSAFPASAQQPVPSGPPAPSQFRRVFISPMGEPFRGDGSQDMVALWFAGADLNHDSQLTRAEFTADAARFFKTLDLDHDGQIAGPEIQRYEFDIVPEASGASEDDVGFGGHWGGGQPGGSGRENFQDEGGGGADGYGGSPEPSESSRPKKLPLEGAARFGILNIPEPVTSADTDFDGRVTWREYETAASLRFALLDANKDGVIMLAELPKLTVRNFERGRRVHRDHHR